MNRMIFLSPQIEKGDSFLFSGSEYYYWIGGNTGNMAFIHAVNMHLLGERTSFYDMKLKPAHWREEYDLIVYPAANHLAADTDIGWISRLVELSGLPILVVGLGAQASFGDSRVELPNGTRRFLDVLRDRGTAVGVRGEFTASILADYGFPHATVIGCPSNFLNPDPQLGIRIADRLRGMPSDPSIALNLTYFTLEPYKVQHLSALVSRGGGSLVFQSDQDILNIIRRSESVDKAKIEYFADYFTGSSDVQDFLKFMARSARCFSHIPSWIDYLRSVDISIGPRFHGNILAMQAGTPAVVFPHDTRTKELAECIGIPTYEWESISRNTNIHDILAQINFDAEAFSFKRQILARKYLEIIQQFGDISSNNLKTLARTL
ncbi:polysaccharide pyruvyl transferase family protein [Neoroseomonas rubea]|uniref:polysaccharide pyruvyl transferase family protein n=1 Tax=Neoroseomonas rubea TaxID=2748666 RepID=UPI0018DF8020|nr:polysaccharide pyruvyl transferase family protein [Roseomonas rubea]